MQRRIARHNRPAEWPVPGFHCEAGASRIFQHIKANPGKSAALAFVFMQDVIVGLMLEFVRLKRRRKLAAQKPHRVELVAFAPHTHPNQVQVIGQEAIGRTPDFFPHRHVQHKFPKVKMERIFQPTGRAMFQRERPQDDGMTLVMMARQSR